MQPEIHPQLFTFGAFIIFHVYFWLEPEVGYSWALTIWFFLSFLFFSFFYQSLCFFGREGSLLAKPLCPTVGFKETGPCNWKWPMKKTKPLAPFLAKASGSEVMVEINESCSWASGLLVAAEMKRQQLKSALGMSVPIRISVWDTVITHATDSSQATGFLKPVLTCSLITHFLFFQSATSFPLIWPPPPPRKNTVLQTRYSSSSKWSQMHVSLSLLLPFSSRMRLGWALFLFHLGSSPWAGVKQLSYLGCPGIHLWNKPANLLNCPSVTGLNLST